MMGWTKPKSGAKYSGVSERTFRCWLKTGLKHSRLPGGRILTRYAWIDEFLERYAVEDGEVDRIVDEVMCKLK